MTKHWTVCEAWPTGRRRALAYKGNVMFAVDRMTGRSEPSSVYMTPEEADTLTDQICALLNDNNIEPKQSKT